MSRSTDHLHCPGSGGEPTGQDNVVLDPPPLEMPPAEPNWVKLRRGVKWQAARVLPCLREVLAPASHVQCHPARNQHLHLHLRPWRGQELGLASSAPCLPRAMRCSSRVLRPSRKTVVQTTAQPLRTFPFNPSPHHCNRKTSFNLPASLEKTANYETGATDWPMSGKNLLSTVDFVQVKPTGYDTEDDIKDGLVVLASPPLCSDGIIEMTLPTSMAKSEIKGDNTNPLPAKDHRGSRQETSWQPPPDRPNSCVHLRRRTKSPEGLRMEKLMKEIIEEDRSLAEILDPSPTTTTIMDLVEGLFQEDTLVLEACQRRGQVYSQTTEAETMTTNTQEIHVPSLLGSDNRCKAAATVTLMPDISRERRDWPTDVTDKKKELIVTIRWKLQRLHEANAALQEDMKVNDSLGEDIAACVGQACKPNETQKYKTFIEDLDKVMGLLLCLSSRLVRVESALNKVNESTGMEEKQSLNERHQTLSHRHEGARGLKVHQDHRERVTFRILRNYLSEIQLQHCHHFVQMRKALIIKQKEIEENLRLTEEQLGFLENSL
ncbi:protein Shroom2-like [Rhinoraja longicauda]